MRPGLAGLRGAQKRFAAPIRVRLPTSCYLTKERCNMAKDKQPGLLYVREDDEYTYYASSMNIY